MGFLAFLDASHDRSAALIGHYDYTLVILSVVVAALAAYAALVIADRIRAANTNLGRKAWLIIGAVTMGSGVWAMHFVGMIAFQLPIPVSYDATMTLVSVFPAILAGSVALQVFSRPRAMSRDRVVAGALMGLGIGTMHYAGMAAMRMNAELVYDPLLFTLSVGVAVALAVASIFAPIWPKGDGRIRLPHVQRLISAMLMGVAISGMHYTGMAATYFFPTSTIFVDGGILDHDLLAYAAAFAAITIAAQAIFVTFVDIRLKSATRIAVISRARLMNAIESISEGFILCDAEDHLVLCNGKVRDDLFPGNSDIMVPGAPFESIMRRVAERHLIKGSEEKPDEWVAQRMARHRDPIGAYTDERTDGRWIQVNERRTEDGGYVALYTEITQLKRAEDELRLSKDQAEAGNLAKSQFLATMSHELRTPLNAVLGYTELIADGIYGDVSPKISEIVNRIRQNGKHLLGLINAVLDLSKIEAGQFSLSINNYVLKDIVGLVISMAEPLAKEKELTLNVELEEDLPVAQGDEQRISQALLNLVGNAVKFTEAGEVVLRAFQSENEFRVSVTDTGPGISETDHNSIFEEFRQADCSSTRTKGGSGLGLTISKSIIEMHGGRIWVESTPMKGATFTFTIPIHANHAVNAGRDT